MVVIEVFNEVLQSNSKIVGVVTLGRIFFAHANYYDIYTIL